MATPLSFVLYGDSYGEQLQGALYQSGMVPDGKLTYFMNRVGEYSLNIDEAFKVAEAGKPLVFGYTYRNLALPRIGEETKHILNLLNQIHYAEGWIEVGNGVHWTGEKAVFRFISPLKDRTISMFVKDAVPSAKALDIIINGRKVQSYDLRFSGKAFKVEIPVRKLFIQKGVNTVRLVVHGAESPAKSNLESSGDKQVRGVLIQGVSVS